MNKDHYLICGFGLIAGATIAVWAGMPFVFLLFLACPLMMFLMMKGMSGMQNATPGSPPATDAVPPRDAPG